MHARNAFPPVILILILHPTTAGASLTNQVSHPFAISSSRSGSRFRQCFWQGGRGRGKKQMCLIDYDVIVSGNDLLRRYSNFIIQPISSTYIILLVRESACGPSKVCPSPYPCSGYAARILIRTAVEKTTTGVLAPCHPPPGQVIPALSLLPRSVLSHSPSSSRASLSNA